MKRPNPILWVALVAGIMGGGVFWGGMVLMSHIAAQLLGPVPVEEVYVEPIHPAVVLPSMSDPAHTRYGDRESERGYGGPR